MRTISRPIIEIMKAPSTKEAYRAIEEAARTCYASHDNTKDGSAERLVSNLVESGHGAMLEFAPDISMRFITTRPVTHEMVRHRPASYAERSQRYCNFSKAKFGSEIEFIAPLKIKPGTFSHDIWFGSCENSEKDYFKLLSQQIAPEDARTVLNQSVITHLCINTNFRHWLESILYLRTSDAAWTEMRRIMFPVLCWMNEKYPVVFGNLYESRKASMAKFFAEYGNRIAEIHEGSDIIRYTWCDKTNQITKMMNVGV